MTPADKLALLARHGIGPGTLIGHGMEAEVYALDDARVLKLYAGTASLDHLQTLQAFYVGLRGASLPFALPEIEQVAEHNDVVITIEQRLRGTPMSDVLRASDGTTHQQMLEKYIDAVIVLGAVQMPDDAERYKLFDPHSLSRRADGDWYAFMRRALAAQIADIGHCLRRDVRDFDAKWARLHDRLMQPYVGRCALVHGDFFPGNILLDDSQQVAALLDFGLFTMWGDPLFDVATACTFFDMYDALGDDLRARCVQAALHKVGAAAHSQLSRYVLVFSILGANAYSPACADGHYAWCVANLNDDTFWQDSA